MTNRSKFSNLKHCAHTLKRNFMRRAFHLYWRFARPMTMGANAIILNHEGHVLLVQHGYAEGLWLPGGGVEAGETTVETLKREIFEETRIIINEEPQLFGLYFNQRVSNRDHITLYVIRNWHQQGHAEGIYIPPAPTLEITGSGFYDPNALPAHTSLAAQRRIAEVLGLAEKSLYW